MFSSLSLSRSVFIFSGFACFAPEPARLGVDFFFKSSIISSIFFFRLVISCLATFYVSSRSTPKYSWIRMSRIPAILFHGMSVCFSFSSSGMFLAASPMISILLITASWIWLDFRNSCLFMFLM